MSIEDYQQRLAATDRSWMELAAERDALKVRVAELETELERERALRREQTSQALDAIDNRGHYRVKRFTKYPCPCGAMISNAGYAAQAHLRGSVHRQNMERKALGLEPLS